MGGGLSDLTIILGVRQAELATDSSSRDVGKVSGKCRHIARPVAHQYICFRAVLTVTPYREFG